MRRLIVIPFLFLAGCHKGSPIVGDWDGQAENGLVPGTIRLSFAANGKYTAVTTLRNAKGTTLTATDTGTWKLDGDRLTTHIDDVNWAFTGSPTSIARGNLDFLKKKPQIIASVNEHPTDTVRWSSDDTFVDTDYKGDAHVFTRRR